MEKGVDHDFDGHRDFDFLHGHWTIHNRRLAKRLQGSTEWQEFDATSEVQPILNGIGNFDRFFATFPDGKPFEGMTLRIFDPETRLWSIYWADTRTCQLGPPVVGRFRNGRGEFRGDDVQDGTPVKVVFTWTDITPNSARWEQAMSADGGKTWEANWEMVLNRAEVEGSRANRVFVAGVAPG